jgi:hypothetical protein
MTRKFLGWTVGLLVLSGLIGGTLTRGDEPGKGKKEEPAPAIILKIDPSTLPPGLLEKLIEAANKSNPKATPKTEEKAEKGKEKAAALTLLEAIARAEKSSGGTTIKVEKKGESFLIDLVGPKGEAIRVVLDRGGKTTGDPKTEKKEEGNRDEKKGARTGDRDEDEKGGKKQKGDRDEDEKGSKQKKGDVEKGKQKKGDKDEDDDEDEKDEKGSKKGGEEKGGKKKGDEEKGGKKKKERD